MSEENIDSHYEEYQPQLESEVEEGEPWLISYADMVTLLMGLFVILFAMSKVDQKKFESVKKEVSEYFGGEYIVPYQDLKDELSRLVFNKDLGKKMDIAVTPEGLEVTFKSRFFFDSGSTELKEEAKKLIKILLETVKQKYKDKWQNLQLIAEGHTDQRPVDSDAIKNNFELSSLRALSVVRILKEEGFSDKQLTVIGYASNQPLIPYDASLKKEAETVAKKLKNMQFDEQAEVVDEKAEHNKEIEDIYSLNRRVVLKILNAPIEN